MQMVLVLFGSGLYMEISISEIFANTIEVNGILFVLLTAPKQDKKSTAILAAL